MKPTDFAKYLTQFLVVYLPAQRNVSLNTIKSYRDTFKLLIRYCQEIEQLPAERITMNALSSGLIIGFLTWLQEERNCSNSTRNQRLAAIHSFYRYVQFEEPAALYHFQKVISIPVKKTQKPIIEHLSPEGIKLFLAQPDRNTPQGRRDLTLLSTLYDSGARVQELIDLRICDISLDGHAVITLTGKGNKARRVPVMNNTALLLKAYLAEKKLNHPRKVNYPLFTNRQHNKLTKEGVAYIVDKYAKVANGTSNLVPPKVNPHMLRHSKAVHLLQAGVNLIYIRDFLGHTDVKTTEVYARADTELKRIALENAYPDLVDSNLPDWNDNQDLLSWLSEF